MPSCPSCGSAVPAGARFCPACGAPLAQAAAAEDMLKLVTVLFADVVGSTARAEASHPEDVRALMASYFEAMAEEIRAEGGTLEKFVGDAIMAVFGVPSLHEDELCGRCERRGGCSNDCVPGTRSARLTSSWRSASASRPAAS